MRRLRTKQIQLLETAEEEQLSDHGCDQTEIVGIA